MELTEEVFLALAAPFPEDEIGFLPRGGSGGQAAAIPYVGAKTVMNRLDFVVKPQNWSFDWQAIGGDCKRIKGTLTVCGVSKSDAGEANAEDEPLKSAVSDALKRCALHFGIGRYLRYIPAEWVPYDAAKRRFTERPRIKPAALDRALRICGVVDAPAAQPQAQQAQQSNGKRRDRPPTQSAVERQEQPLSVTAGAVEDGRTRASRKVAAALAEIGLESGKQLVRRISELALDRSIEHLAELDAADIGSVAEWITAHPNACHAVEAEQASTAGQSETLPLEGGEEKERPAQARGA